MAGVRVLYFGANFSCCNNYPPFMNNEEKIEHAKGRRMVINLCLGIYIAHAEDEEFSVVDAV